ncbi:ferrous iron transport protein B [Bacteriovorax sp. BAL6_X]|uniref:ferrous iron transport protein B n=1 Tax=Bacteriovorax sp. BAL6_X TaxID=1201290 RepID=UPI00038591BC|nr:ferrous iron transport protein B [Bacteriovorax sp. BAL6_X]EPZ49754.1 ferrous iron transport protein B [Bacteriovorax sp. BAL6_X]
MRKILLIGPANSGKSAIFNLLSGANRKVANYNGITVDTATAGLISNARHEKKLAVVDLPGIYSLVPSSIDEAVTVSTLIGRNNQVTEFHDIVCVVDCARLDSSLSLALAVKELFGGKIKIIFNKYDLDVTKNYDFDKIGEHIGVPYIKFSTMRDSGATLENFLRDNASDEILLPSGKIKLSNESTEYNPFNVSFEEDQFVELQNEVSALSQIEKYQREARDLKASYAIGKNKSLIQLSNKIDQFVLHPLLGGIIFLAIFYLIFHSIYTWAGPAMDLIDGGVGAFGEYIATLLPEGMLNSFIVDGIIAGVGGVVIFLPQIMILFFLLSLLEQSGYISRASIITDRAMSYFGLNGKAFLPYLSGFACSVPAIMATRTISDKKERLATLMTIPLITCSARLPVYILLIGTFVPEKTVFGIFNSQALAFFFLYFLGSIVALIIAKIFRLTLYKGSTTSFIIELPLYQMPTFKPAFKSMIFKGKVFLKKAGTIILGLSMVIWFLSTFPKPAQEMLVGKTEAEAAAISLEHSTIGQFGKLIEPVIKPLGYNWKMGVGITVAMGARELFVSTLGTIYALGDVDEESTTLRERLRAEIDPETNEPVFNTAVAWSLLIFFAFAMQCISTLGIVRRETDGWGHVFLMFGYMTILAYGGAFVTYHLLI